MYALHTGDMTLVGDHDWASTTCFNFPEETDEITEILVTASGDYVMALELKAQVFQDALYTSPQAYTYIHTYIHACMHAYIYIYIYVYAYVCLYILFQECAPLFAPGTSSIFLI